MPQITEDAENVKSIKAFGRTFDTTSVLVRVPRDALKHIDWRDFSAGRKRVSFVCNWLAREHVVNGMVDSIAFLPEGILAVLEPFHDSLFNSVTRLCLWIPKNGSCVILNNYFE